MSFPILSNILQNNIKMLEEQYHDMQQRYKEEQWLLVCLEEVVEAYCIECVAQKARKEAKK